MIKLLTFDQVEKEKAAGQASTDLSARLADLIQDYKGATSKGSRLLMNLDVSAQNAFQQPWILQCLTSSNDLQSTEMLHSSRLLLLPV